jgi:hypothetical protein
MHTTQVYILKHNQLSSTIQKLWRKFAFSNQTEAGRQLGISQNTINTCCVKKRATLPVGFGFRLQKTELKYEIKTTKKESYTIRQSNRWKIAVFESLANTAQQLGLWSSNIGS